MSSIHYKFRSLKDYDTYTFEGAGVPVWELKQEIVNAKKLSRANDFELIISNAQTNQEYSDDNLIIPKNSSVIVKRVPAAPGKRFFQPRTLTARPPPSFNNSMSAAGASGTLPKPATTEEDAKIAAMMNASTSHWNQNQEMPSQSLYSSNKRNFRPMTPNLPPPSNYICFRCGQKGHYIAMCPTLEDPNYNRPKIRKTTGIPKTFLRPVENRPDESGLAPTIVPPTGNVLISAEGNLVTLQTNEDLWNRVSGLSRVQDLSAERAPEHFKCPLCVRVLTDPVYFSCCPDVNYCDECIRNFLLRNESAQKASACRACRKPVRVDDLNSNSRLAQEIVEFFGGSKRSKEQ